MSRNYKIHYLNKIANNYFNDRLNVGLTLSSYLKDSVVLDQGRVITYAPSEIPDHELINFNGTINQNPIIVDNVEKIDKTEVNKWLLKHIHDFLSSAQDTYVILEEADDYPQSTVITRFPFRNVLFNNEPYYLLDKNDSKETIHEAIVQNTSYYPLGMGVFTTIKDISRYFSDKDHISDKKFFKVLSENTQKIYIQAYDQEGYVLWEKL